MGKAGEELFCLSKHLFFRADDQQESRLLSRSESVDVGEPLTEVLKHPLHTNKEVRELPPGRDASVSYFAAIGKKKTMNSSLSRK